MKTKDAVKTHSCFLEFGQKSHALQSLFLVCYGKNWAALLPETGVGVSRDALSHFTCGWLMLPSLSHSFHCPHFSLPGWSLQTPLVRLAWFKIGRISVFPFKSSEEQQIQCPTLDTMLEAGCVSWGGAWQMLECWGTAQS